ncbi:MAG: VPLPA-CTERM sorting domain-containing protein [Tateyamaria sp.]
MENLKLPNSYAPRNKSQVLEMRMNFFAVSAFAVWSVIAGTSASAATVTPDVLTIESNGNRANGAALADVKGIEELGDITGLTAGIAGRIVNAVDTFSFTYNTSFNVDFANLLDTAGVDIDGCEGFDGSDCSVGSRNNEPGRTAIFSLSNGVDHVLSAVFSSTIAAGTSIFSNVAAGTYTFTIDGTTGKAGSAYDIAISATPVPVPAGAPLLLSALGVAGLVRRRKQKCSSVS